MFKCIIFDLDGTLVDSEMLNARALSEMLGPLGLSQEALRDTYRGRKLAEIIDDLEQTHGAKIPPGFVASYRDYVELMYRTELKEFDGVAEALLALDLPLCVASNAPLRKMTAALHATNLSRFFGPRLFSAYDVGAWKPDPGLFLAAAKAMNAGPHECLVIEDSAPGVQAASAAGMMCLQFRPETNAAEQEACSFQSYSELCGAIESLGCKVEAQDFDH